MALPNLAVHKKHMLESLGRKTKADAIQQQKVQILNQRMDQNGSGANDLERYVQGVQDKIDKFEDEFVANAEKKAAVEEEGQDAKKMAQSRKAYYRELKKVIEAADVVIEVLDARDPEGCRSEEIEQEVLKQNKKLLLVLNKIDLVPPQNARMWQKYLRTEFPCILFKANQQNQQKNYGMGASLHKQSMIDKPGMIETMVNASTAVGTENLMNILKNYARVEGQGKLKQTIYVGVVGFPNVGKSSLINSLKRSRAAAIGNTPGVTKTMQEIQIDKNIILLDSPGVVLSTKEQSNSLILRSAIKVDELEDPIRPIDAIIDRIDRQEICELYGLEGFESVDGLLGHISRTKGFLKSGGVPNFDQAARKVIRDYLDGKMNFFTPAPHADGEDDETGVDQSESFMMDDQGQYTVNQSEDMAM